MQKKIFIYITVIIGTFLIFYAIFHKKEKSVGKILTVAFDAKVLSFDPRMIGSDPASQYIEELRFLPLISFDQKGNLINVLAEKLYFENDNLFINLKKGIHFADGTEITADDVKSTYDAILFPPADAPPNPRKNFFNNLASVTVKEKYQIIFTLKNRDVSFPNNLVVGILPKHAIETEPIGTLIGKNYESGPFVLVKSNHFQLNFIVNKNYDFDAKPKISEFCIKIIPDSTTRYAALIKGDVDIIQNSLDPDKVYLIENTMQKRFDVIKGMKLATTYLGFNFKDPILNNKDIRAALAYGLDRASILKYRLRSDELPATGMFPETFFYFDPNLMSMTQIYDKQTAREWLKNSHLPPPVKLKLTVSSSNKTHVEIAKTMAINLKDIGFDIEVENLENSLFFQRINRGLVQIWLAPWVGFKDPDHLRFVFSSTMFPPKGANRGYYSNSELDALFEQGRTEFDQMKRKEIYLKAQEIIAHDMPYLFLWHGTNTVVFSKRVHGFDVYADGRYWGLTQTSLSVE